MMKFPKGRRAAECAIILLLVISASVSGAHPPTETGLPAGACGVYLWPDWRPETMNRHTCPFAKGATIICSWDAIEPQAGEFQFDREIGDKLRAAVNNNYFVSLALWTSPNNITPEWLYEAGVPAVRFKERLTPFLEKKHDHFPYYFNTIYQGLYRRLLERTGDYLASLPQELRDRIAFVEVCEGATGDPAPYYGNNTKDYFAEPLDPQYRISRRDWSRYRIELWKTYQAIFQNERIDYPLLVKSADIVENEFAWLLASLPVLGSKQAYFCEYYQHSGVRSRLKLVNNTRAEIKNAGKTYFSRGEYDAQFKLFGWSTRHPDQALYWTAIYASHAELDIWQVHHEALQLNQAKQAVEFFNRYAGHRTPETSPAAFCVLRRGLDAADTDAFPESLFGKADRQNIDRYQRIAAAYKHRGARQGDPQKAVAGLMTNRRSEDFNDVGWDILPGNYGRFLKQIDANETSIGWWHVGLEESIYGRFARGLDVATGKDRMFFRLADGFCNANQPHTLLLKIVYLDNGTGVWNLRYHTTNGMKEALSVSNTDSGQWRETSVIVSDAAMQHGGPRGADLILASQKGDCIFHLIEVQRAAD